MRLAPLVLTVATLAVVTCTGTDRGVFVAPSGPQFDHVQDLDGTPDLIVDGKKLATSWVVYEQELRESFCSLAEGGTTPGFHRVLRMTVTTPNIGDADIFIGDPQQHWDPNGDGNPVDSDGLFELSNCHRHFHFRNYATYELLSADRTQTWLSAKHGFCMIDVTPWNNNDGGVSSWVYRSCGRPTFAGFAAIPGNQGISVGYADTYNKWLGGQYFVLDGGNGRPVVPPGNYIIRIHVNPPFECGAGDAGKPRDPAGKCHNFLESNYGNNIAEVAITIPDHPGKKGFGPGGGQTAVDEIVDDENRPDK